MTLTQLIAVVQAAETTAPEIITDVQSFISLWQKLAAAHTATGAPLPTPPASIAPLANNPEVANAISLFPAASAFSKAIASAFPAT